MASDRDIWASALVMVKQHGEDAETEASVKADACAAKNDFAGQKAWLRIIAAVKWLQDNRGRDPFKVEH